MSVTIESEAGTIPPGKYELARTDEYQLFIVRQVRTMLATKREDGAYVDAKHDLRYEEETIIALPITQTGLAAIMDVATKHVRNDAFLSPAAPAPADGR